MNKFPKNIGVYSRQIITLRIVYVTCLTSRLILAFYCVGYPRVMSYFKNKLPYSLLKPSKREKREEGGGGGECSLKNTLNLEKLRLKIHNYALLQDILGLFCYNAHMPWFSIISPSQRFPWYNHRKTWWTTGYYK